MEAEFRSILANDAAVAALVAARLYWGIIPQAATDPCIRLTKVNRIADAHHGGASGLDSTLVQVDIRTKHIDGSAAPFAQAVAIRDAVVTKLHAKRLTQDGIEFKSILLTSERHRAEKPDTTLYHTIQLDFEMWTGVAG